MDLFFVRNVNEKYKEIILRFISIAYKQLTFDPSSQCLSFDVIKLEKFQFTKLGKKRLVDLQQHSNFNNSVFPI